MRKRTGIVAARDETGWEVRYDGRTWFAYRLKDGPEWEARSESGAFRGRANTRKEALDIARVAARRKDAERVALAPAPDELLRSQMEQYLDSDNPAGPAPNEAGRNLRGFWREPRGQSPVTDVPISDPDGPLEGDDPQTSVEDLDDLMRRLRDERSGSDNPGRARSQGRVRQVEQDSPAQG